MSRKEDKLFALTFWTFIITWVIFFFYFLYSVSYPCAKVPNVVEKCQCPAVPKCPVESSTKQTPTEEENYRLALNFYRKFLTRTFDEVDEENTSFKLRKFNVQFKVTDQQLRKLKEAQTARKIDAVVTIIVEQSEISVYQSMAESLCWNIVAWYGSALQSSIFLYVIIPAVVILSVLSIGRLLGMRLWVLIPFLAILITYVLTYRNCNNQRELESITKLMKTYGSNPCGKQHPSEAACIEHLREQYELKRSFCDPSEVFIEMVAKLHLQYFENFVLKMVSIFKVITASSGPVKTLFIGGSMLFLMTVGIMYGLRAVGRFLTVVITSPRTRKQAAVQGDARHTKRRPRRAISRVEQTTNRIEEITKGASALVPASDGSAVKNETTTDEGASSDEETSMMQCGLADDVRKDPAENTTDNQSKTSVDQQISAQNK